jgi:hypothetical protein
MLILLIPIAWIAVVALLVVLCRIAARADATPAPAADSNPRSIGGGLVRWEAPPAPTLATDWTLHDIARRPQDGDRLGRGRPSPRRRRIAVHGIR